MGPSSPHTAGVLRIEDSDGLYESVALVNVNDSWLFNQRGSTVRLT